MQFGLLGAVKICLLKKKIFKNNMISFLLGKVKKLCVKKSRIRETKHLLTDADSSTNTTVGRTKNTRKPDFFEKRKKSSKAQKLKNV